MPGQQGTTRRSQAVVVGHRKPRIQLEAGGGGLPEDSKLRVITSRAADRELARTLGEKAIT